VTSLWLSVWGAVLEIFDLGDAVSVNGIDTFSGLLARWVMARKLRVEYRRVIDHVMDRGDHVAAIGLIKLVCNRFGGLRSQL
jgi:hypothetical protein